VLTTDLQRHHELKADYTKHVKAVHVARGSLRRLRSHVIDADISAHVEALSNGNEALRRLLQNKTERARVFGDVGREFTQARRAAAGIAVHALRSVTDYVAACRDWVENTRRDVSLSFEDAFLNLSADGLVMLGVYKLHRTAMMSVMSVGELSRTYTDALRNHSATSAVDAELIEALLDRNAVTATSEKEIATLRELRQTIDTVRETRLPVDLPDVDTLEADVRRLHQRADLLQVIAVDPAHPSAAEMLAAYQAQESDLIAAGQPSDRDDLAAVNA